MMCAKKKVTRKNATRQSPQTIRQLSDRVDRKFAHLAKLFEASLDASKSAEEQRRHAAGDARQLVTELKATLEENVGHLELLLKDAPPQEGNLLDRMMIELARAQLAAGEGERFEPAINEAIRHYCDTRKEVRYFSNDKTLSNQQRQNVVAGFQRILSEQKIRLHKLDIHIEEVKPGSPIERSHHEVHTKISTGNAQQLHTVAECILPVFTWKNADGIEQRKPALVVAYTDLRKSEDTFDELPSDVFEEIDDFESVPLKSR